MLATQTVQPVPRTASVRAAAAAANDHESFAARLHKKGFQVEHVDEAELESSGQACFTVIGEHKLLNGRAICADLADGTFCARALTQMALVHPHVAALEDFTCIGQHLCFFVSRANGGALFEMVRRGGPGGLPACAALYLTQQLATTAEFLHGSGLYLHELSPAALQVRWAGGGLPLAVVETLQLPCEAIAAKGCAALHTTPQAARIAADPGATTVMTSGMLKAFKVACDVWALAVALHYMLFCRFPFSRGEIGAWAGKAAPQWDGDAGVTYTKASGMPVDGEIVAWLKNVFAAGRLPAADFAARFGSMAALFEQQWFVEDLPKGAREMSQRYQARTAARRKSPRFQELAAAFGAATPAAAAAVADAHAAALPLAATQPAPDAAATAPVESPATGQPPFAAAAANDATEAAQLNHDFTQHDSAQRARHVYVPPAAAAATGSPSVVGDVNPCPTPESQEERSHHRELNAERWCVHAGVETHAEDGQGGPVVPSQEGAGACGGGMCDGRAACSGAGGVALGEPVMSPKPLAMALCEAIAALCRGRTRSGAAAPAAAAAGIAHRASRAVLHAAHPHWGRRAFTHLCHIVFCVCLSLGWQSQKVTQDLA